MSAQAVKADEPEYGYKGPRKLLMGDLKRSEVARPDYRVLIKDEKTTVEDVTRPEYWANVSEMLAKDTWPFAIIELIWADASRYMRLLVLDCGRLYAKVKILERHDFSADEKPVSAVDTPVKTKAKANESDSNEDKEQNLKKNDPAGYEVKYCGPVDKHCVIRLSDGEKLHKEVSTKADAQKWLDDYIKALS